MGHIVMMAHSGRCSDSGQIVPVCQIIIIQSLIEPRFDSSLSSAILVTTAADLTYLESFDYLAYCPVREGDIFHNKLTMD